MEINEFQELSTRTMPEGDKNGKANYALGVTGEGGEVADIIKKHLFHGHELNREKLIEELGDVMHYVSGVAKMFDISLEEITEYNLNKLKDRYPEGFSKERSINRVR
ncbi:MAG: nucleoside triphosphate pyrophosphohydrolase family protein [Bacilli bacterium]|nr:nucleoside triphosphate pyrophosphohydrolase family protein [Bacilli bacterium]MBR3119688.1 nucleoside triphosphate pyrophosphohydrolase family protein [Oceanobacillus sp.]